MNPRWTSLLTGSQVFEADARLVATTIPPGCASLAILDGPYGLAKAAWDRIPRGGTLADLYQGHLDDVGRVCAASASLYLWNTSAGWAELHPHILARGWTFRALITWDKGVASMAGKVDTAGLRTWFDVTEVCGFYQREIESPFPELLQRRREVAGLSRRDLAELFPSRTGGLTGCLLNWEAGYNVPTREQWIAMMSRIQECGTNTMPVHSGNEYDSLRAEYEASRAPFTCPLGVGNVWSAGQVAGPERLKDGNGDTMHPCQKPLLFAERMIRASSRPGDLVWAPFGGTLRELVAAERMARLDPGEARKVVTCELNLDGRDYIGAALEQIGAEVRPKGRQVGLFGVPR